VEDMEASTLYLTYIIVGDVNLLDVTHCGFSLRGRMGIKKKVGGVSQKLASRGTEKVE
jgi:hypothetical protein